VVGVLRPKGETNSQGDCWDLSLSVVPFEYMLSKGTAFGRGWWCVHDEKRRPLQSLDYLRLLQPPRTKRN
jgi:hypothetical protein